MKLHHTLLLILVVMFTFSACREITVTTKINNDGSFTRVITITGDSADLFKKDLPYPIDDSWVMELKHDSVDTSLYVTYTKTYTDSDLLNAEMQSDTSWMSQLDRTVEIKKRFGFFYSYLTFNEVIKAANPFTVLDYRIFLDPEELQWLNNEKIPLTPADTATLDKVEEKAMEFIAKSLTAELIPILEKGIRELDNPAIDQQIPQIYHDSIYNLVDKWEFDNLDFFIDHLSIWMGNIDVLKLKDADFEIFNEFNAKAQFFNKIFEMSEYNQLVEMPGIITETNSLMLKGNQVSWKVQPLSFLLSEYKMEVESRVVNYWMFAFTGLMVLLLLLLLVFKALK